MQLIRSLCLLERVNHSIQHNDKLSITQKQIFKLKLNEGLSIFKNYMPSKRVKLIFNKKTYLLYFLWLNSLENDQLFSFPREEPLRTKIAVLEISCYYGRPCLSYGQSGKPCCISRLPIKTIQLPVGIRWLPVQSLRSTMTTKKVTRKRTFFGAFSNLVVHTLDLCIYVDFNDIH